MKRNVDWLILQPWVIITKSKYNPVLFFLIWDVFGDGIIILKLSIAAQTTNLVMFMWLVIDVGKNVDYAITLYRCNSFFVCLWGELSCFSFLVSPLFLCCFLSWVWNGIYWMRLITDIYSILEYFDMVFMKCEMEIECGLHLN